MKLTGKTSKREVRITLGIWAVLLVLGIAAVLLLRYNVMAILERLYFVNVGRGQKAQVLYAEAEKHSRAVLEKAHSLNKSAHVKVSVPETYPQLRQAEKLYEQAFEWDARPEFDLERSVHYELLAQVEDAAGDASGQLINNARAFMTVQNYGDARDYLTSAIRISGAPEATVVLAQLSLKEHKTSEAIALLNELESSKPLSAKALWVKSQGYVQQLDNVKAEESLRKAVEAAPKNLTFRQDLGQMLYANGNSAESIRVMEAGLDDGGWLDPAYLHVYGDYLTNAGDLAEAIRVLKQADELAPWSGDIQWSLARAYHKAGKAALAASALRRATEAKPELHDNVFDD